MIAGFEGHEELGTARARAGAPERLYLGVWLAVLAMPPLADDLSVPQHHGADQRIG
jgi:hypothetical protein